MNNKKWLNILKFNCYITIFVGFLSVIASSTLTQLPWLMLLDFLIYPLDNNPNSFRGNEFILNAVLGGIMMGWATMMLMLAKHIENLASIRKAFITSIIVWFIFDSSGSFVSGVYGNIVFNCFFLGMLLIPIINIKPIND